MVKKILPKAIGFVLQKISLVAPNQAGDLALRIFRSPLAGKLSPKNKDFLQSSEKTHALPFEGGTVMLYEWNTHQKQSVLLLHGWESNAARWEHLIRQLVAEGKRVLAVDAPAHGASSGKAFDMLKYSRVVGLIMKQYQPNVIIGHSVGGAALTIYLHQYPDTPIKNAAILGVPSEFRHIANTFTQILGLSQRMSLIVERRFETYYQMTYEEISVANYCKNITTPMLVIHDKQDDFASVEDAYLYDKNLANSQLLITDGLGHSLQGEEVYKALRTLVEN